MSDYSQPDFYRFNEDSLRLVRWIEDYQLSPGSILDLGAGCGVIGIELANKLNPKILTLLEVQEDYRSHLEANIRNMLLTQTNTNIEFTSFSQWVPDRKYDLIVCNPPYFSAGRGEVSKDQRKHMARTFVLDGWDDLFKIITNSLSPEGKAFIVIRRDQIVPEKVLHKFKIREKDHLKFLELS